MARWSSMISASSKRAAHRTLPSGQSAAGIKEKYIIQKSGVPMKQLHSYDYSGPYAGFKAPSLLPGD